jgi:hypothetical protein
MDIKVARFLGGCIVGASVILAVAIRSPNGRYQLTTTAGHAYVLDTATGQVWEKYAPPNEGMTDQGFRDPK